MPERPMFLLVATGRFGRVVNDAIRLHLPPRGAADASLRRLLALARRALFGTLLEIPDLWTPGRLLPARVETQPHLYVSFRRPAGTTSGYGSLTARGLAGPTHSPQVLLAPGSR